MSLVAAVSVAGLSSVASADVVKDAFAEAKVNGQLKAQYFTKEKASGTDKDSSIFAVGGNLNFETAPIHGLSGKMTFQTSHVPDIDDKSNAYSSDMDASGSVLSQAYLQYKISDTTAKYGRQYIGTKLVNGSGSRMIKQSFSGLTVVNKSVPDTTFVAGLVERVQERTDGNGAPGKFTNTDSVLGITATLDNAYVVHVKNESVKNLNLTAEYLRTNIDVANVISFSPSTIYADASYKIPMGKNALTLAAQTYNSKIDLAGITDGSLYAVKVAADIGPVTLVGAYSTQDDGVVYNGLGSNAEQIFTESSFRGGRYSADLDAYQLKAIYKLNDQLKFRLTHTNWENKNPVGPDNKKDESETSVRATYQVNKDLSLQARYGTFDNYSYDYRARFYATYNF
jgi:hypothetical protein